jgi:DNA-binding response OmpR family regulator
MKIMIVEDDVIPANYLKKMIELEGYNVIAIVQKGMDAIQIAKEKKPDLILMDIMLQDQISGAEAAKEIHYLYPEIFIIFLTAYSDKEMVDYAVESEAFAYLLKPYRDNEILATLSLAKAKFEEQTKIMNNEIKSNNEIIELVDGYVFDTKLSRLFLDQKEVKLSKKSLKLISVLCNNRHVSVELSDIIANIWEDGTSEQALRSLIHRTREKTSHNLILNSNSFGYKIGLKE